ncbi:MAG: hypothetical protein ACR2GE_03180 [Pseudonocardia sp.]
MLDGERAARAADVLWDAWCTGKRIDALPADVHPADAAEGMAAQLAMEQLAGPGYGWKIAATSAAGQRPRLPSGVAHLAGLG